MAEEQEKKKDGFLWTLIRENFQSIGVMLLLALGLKKPAQTGDSQTGQQLEKEAPGWFLTAFPGWTKDDETEYNLILDSADDNASIKDVRIAAEEFEDRVKNDFWYDEVGYRVSLVLLRREFLERLKHPVPKDDSNRIKFQTIEIRDSAKAFMERLLEEKTKRELDLKAASSDEEREEIRNGIYEEQKKIAIKRKLLPERHWLKMIVEDKLMAISIAIVIFCLLDMISYLFSRI